MKKWEISCRKTSCAAQFGWWGQMKALFARMLHIPTHIPTSHPTLKPLWKSSAEKRLGCPRGRQLCPIPPLFPPSHNNLCQQSPPGIKSHFSAQELAKQRSCGAGGAKSWLEFSYVMDEHTPLMLLKRFNVWYSPNEIKGTKNWKQGMFTITGTWRAVMSHGKINFPPEMHFLGSVSLLSPRLSAGTCFNAGMEKRN